MHDVAPGSVYIDQQQQIQDKTVSRGSTNLRAAAYRGTTKILDKYKRLSRSNVKVRYDQNQTTVIPENNTFLSSFIKFL